jgi:hypothetical protein
LGASGFGRKRAWFDVKGETIARLPGRLRGADLPDRWLLSSLRGVDILGVVQRLPRSADA